MKFHSLIILFLICLVGSAFSQSTDKDTTNTHGERIDTATERQAFREALDMWTDDTVTLGSLTLGTTLKVDTIYDAAGNTTPLLSLTNGILGEYNPHRLNFNDGTLEVYDGSVFIPSIDYGQYKIYDNTYTELLDWSAGIAFTGTPTLAGDFDISGQVEATGQSADTDDSLMTRSLVDTDRWLNSARLWSPLVIPSFTKTGTGSISQTNAGDSWITLRSGTSVSGYGKAVIGRGLNSAPGLSGVGIYFNKPIGLSCNIAFFTANNESNRVRLVIGTDTSAPAAAGDDPISDNGFGVEIKRTATHTQWRVFAHNGTSFTASSFTNLYSGTRLHPQTLAVYSDSNGNITAYYANYGADSCITITTTGGPTGTGAHATSRVAIEAANSSSGTSTSKANVYSCKFYTPNN